MLRLALLLALVALPVHAAELTVFSGGSMAEPLRQAMEPWARANGHTLRFSAGTTGVMLGRIRAGEQPDVVAISAEAMETLDRQGRFLPGTRQGLARALLGVGVRVGSPRPDIATVEAFRRTMLAAKSIAYPDPALGATSGVYLQSLFERLGIGPQMKAKTVVKPVGAAVAEAAAHGEVEFAVTFVSEMMAEKGLAVVGTLPAEVLNPSPYAVAVSATAANPEAARAFVAYATGPQAAAALKAAGVDPAARRP